MGSLYLCESHAGTLVNTPSAGPSRGQAGAQWRLRWDCDILRLRPEKPPSLAQVLLALGEACSARETPRPPWQEAT